MRKLMIQILSCLTAAFVLGVTVCAQDNDGVVVMTVPDEQSMSVGADAAIVMEAQTGRVMFAQDEHEQLPFASTTKIMTALLALEQTNLDVDFVVDTDAIQVEGSSMGLQEGDVVTLRTLAAGMLLASGNDAANAAAVRIEGSIPAFVEKMNERAQELGLQNTSFETPSGLDGEAHYSSAYDLAVLAQEALRNDAFRDICSQYKMRLNYGNPPYERWLTNHNKLLNYYEGTIGVKTGFTKKAGRCLVSAAERDGVTLIVVTLNCPNDWTTHENLYDRFFPDLEIEDLALGLPQIDIPIVGGTVSSIEADRYLKATVPVPVGGAEVTYDIAVEPFLYAPVRSGQTVGQVRIYLDGEPVYNLTLTSPEDVELQYPYEDKPDFWACFGMLIAAI